MTAHVLNTNFNMVEWVEHEASTQWWPSVMMVYILES